MENCIKHLFAFLKFCLKLSFIGIRDHSLELDISHSLEPDINLIKLSQSVEFVLWKNE